MVKYGEHGYISYDKLWETLKKKNHNQQWLINNGIHRSTIYKMKDNDSVNLSVIAELCHLLNCQPGNIIEYKKEE